VSAGKWGKRGPGNVGGVWGVPSAGSLLSRKEGGEGVSIEGTAKIKIQKG